MKLYLQIRGTRGKAPDNTVLVQSLGSGAAYQVEVSVEGVVGDNRYCRRGHYNVLLVVRALRKRI